MENLTNPPILGATVCSLHAYNEIRLRISGAKDHGQSEEVLSLADDIMMSISSLVADKTDSTMVSIHDTQNNNTVYTPPAQSVSFIQSKIAELYGHVCVIGELAAALLSDVYFYVELIDTENPNTDQLSSEVMSSIKEGWVTQRSRPDLEQA